MMEKIKNILLVGVLFLFCKMQAQTTILNEDFSGGLPAGWSNIDNGGSPSGSVWEFNDPGSRGITAGNISGNYAILDSDNYGNGNNQDATLETASFGANLYETITLEYDYQYRDYQSPESCTVEVYNGSSWTTVASYTTDSGDNYVSADDGATHVTIDITTAAGSASNAKVRFTYSGDWDWWWALDNVEISGTVAVTELTGHLGPGGVGDTDGSSSLELWLRGDKDVTSNGSDEVTAWLDNSGNGNDVSFIGGNPTYTASINGNEVISLDGNDYFESSVANNTGTQASVYFAGKIRGYTDSWGGIISGSKSGELDWNSLERVVFLNRNSTTDDIESHRAGEMSVFTDGLLGTDVKIMNSQYDGSNNTVRLDGVNGSTVSSTASFDYDLIGIGKRMTENKYTIGEYAEVIYFDESLNLAQTIIIENYLQAKYDGTLAANDFYDEDDNGDFDYDVAGIGQATDGSSHTDSQGTGIVRINNPRSLGNDEFLFWGRNNKDALSFSTNTGNYKQRLNTVWRVSRRNNPGRIDITFDLSGVDLSGKQDCADLILVRDNNSDLLSPSTSTVLTDLGDGFYGAENVLMGNNNYFTLEYQDLIVVDGTQFYNGSGASNVPDASDDCYKLLVKSTATGSLTLTENADVRELEVESGGNLVVATGTRLRVSNAIDNSGEIRLIGTSQLLQTHTGTSQNLSNTGKLYIDQQGTNDSKYRYNYWSSPVVPVGETKYSVGAVLKDGTTATGVSTTPPSVLFTTGLDGDYTTSPAITISSNWLYKYESSWSHIGDAGEINPGQGYTMKGTGAIQGYTFVGVPNDGKYTVSVLEDESSLLGNPYPSALDADAFLTLNSVTNGVIDGSLYFWEHNGETSVVGDDGHYTANYEGGYAVRNIGGGVAAVAPTGVAGLGTSSGNVPGQYIAVAQGFFIGTVADGDIEFNNSMRAFEEEGASSIFYKGKSTKKTAVKNSTSKQFPSLRIGFDQTNSGGLLLRRELLAVFKEGLTDAYDNGYDSSIYDLQDKDAYWKFSESDNKYVIAGVDNYILNDDLPLEVAMDTEGVVSFSVIEKTEIEDRVYLHDELKDVYYGLTDGSVSLDLEAGTYTDRFSITFKEDINLAVENVSNIETNLIVYHNALNKEIVVKTSEGFLVESIEIYTLIGQKLDSIPSVIVGEEMKIPVPNLSSGVYIVRILTDKGVVSKKVIVE